MTRRTIQLIGAVLVAAVATSLVIGVAVARRSDLAIAKAESARFHSVEQAEKAGYGLLPEGAPLRECISTLDPVNAPGAMGLHYVNGELLDETLDIRNPEVLVYAPDQTGKLKLAALEYVIFEDAWSGSGDPTLFGQPFDHTGFPNRYDIPAFYALHVWLWEDNPAGIFKPFNPDVACP
jgi:hypothetical protein